MDMIPDSPESPGSVCWGAGFLLATSRGPDSKLKKKSGNVPVGNQGDFRALHFLFLLCLSQSIISDFRTKE